MNRDCATGSGQPLTHDQAAARAIEIARSRGREGLCVPLDGSLSKTSSTASLNNTISKTPSSISEASSVADSLPERSPMSPNQTPEPMETTDSTADYNVQPSYSTDSVGGTGNPLILIHSRASTGDTPPVSRRYMPDPSGISASSSSESGISGPTGLTTTTSVSAESESVTTSREFLSDSLSNISMEQSSSDAQLARIRSSVKHAFASNALLEPYSKFLCRRVLCSVNVHVHL